MHFGFGSFFWHGQCGQLSALKQIYDLYQHGVRKKLLGKINMQNYWREQSII